MTNREKVIKGLECAIGIRGRKNCDDCPYDNDFNCIGCDVVMSDAIDLLKEQEPKSVCWRLGRAHCPSCGELFPKKQDKQYIRFCNWCGQAVKWE